jgi:hypothetical protein
MPFYSRPLLLVALGLPGCTSRQAAVGSPPASSTAAAATTRFTTVTFERTPCYGTCAVYKVNVAGDGTVRFTGERNVDSVGTFMAMITPAAVTALGQAFDEAKYYDLDSKYGMGQANCSPYGTDASSIRTSITTTTRSKSVDHDLGCGNVPTRLADLYRKFDTIVGTARWIGRR